jgi:hypothetical protein
MLFVRRLIWDAWNMAHIARHDAVPEEVEQVCHNDPITDQSYGGRLRVLGLTRSRRMLTAILAPYGRGVYYPVTARPASRKEPRLYREQKGGVR